MPKETTSKATATKRVRRTVKTAATRRRATAAPAVTHEQIATRAYELHLAGTDGDAMAHWLRAERELVGA
jgi:predicted metal-dependent phosphotriesterase family hydrolase